MPCQIFSILFSNLTTSITEVEIYLCTNPTLRDRLPKELSEFKQMYDKVNKSFSGPKGKSLSGSNLEGDKHEAAYTKALPGQMIPARMSCAEKVVQSLNWNPVKYASEWKINQGLMSLKLFKRPNRTADRLGERLLVMSGLSWNPDSHSANRDWSSVLAAVTLETALVESYRSNLLKACPGACKLRKEMWDFFYGIATFFHQRHPATGTAERVREWEFPDGIPSGVGTPGGKSYDPDDLRKQLRDANPTATLPKAKHDNLHATISNLEKNKLLWSSDPDAAYGSIETLAHDCIYTLARVSQPHLCTHASSPTTHASMFTDNAFQLCTDGT